QRGSSHNVQNAPATDVPAKPRIDRGKAFSALHLVDTPEASITRENETAVLPLRIVSNQHDYTNLSYQVPPNATRGEFIEAFNATPVVITGSNHVHLYPKDNLAIVRFTNVDDHATFKSATVTMRGQPLQQRAFKTYNPRISFVTLYSLMEADAKTAAGIINKAMMKYGQILDIVLYKKGTFLSDTAQVVIEMAEDLTVDGIIHTEDYIVHAVVKPTRVKPVVQTTKVDTAGDTRVAYESMQVDDDGSDDDSTPSLTESSN
ncbi:hypothetical protein LPJ73_001460, partial [Coemansia sp. RSA 2703]